MDDYEHFKNSIVGIKVDEAHGKPFAHLIVDVNRQKGGGIVSATVTPILLSYTIALGKKLVEDAIDYATAIVDGEIDSDKSLYDTAKEFLKNRYGSTAKLISKLLLKPLFLEGVLSSTYSSVLESLPENTSIGQWIRNQVQAKAVTDRREEQQQVRQAQRQARQAGWFCDACQTAYSANTRQSTHNQSQLHQRNVRLAQEGQQPVAQIQFNPIQIRRNLRSSSASE